MYNHKDFAFFGFFLISYKSCASLSIQNAKNPQLVKFAYLENSSKAKQENKRSNTELFEKISDDVWKLMIYKYFNLKMLSNFKSTCRRFNQLCSEIEEKIEKKQRKKLLTLIALKKHSNNKYNENKELPCDVCLNNISHIKTFKDIVTNNSFAFRATLNCFDLTKILFNLIYGYNELELHSDFFCCINNTTKSTKIIDSINENHKVFLIKATEMIKQHPLFIEILAKSNSSYIKKINEDIDQAAENYHQYGEGSPLGDRFYEFQIFSLEPSLFFLYFRVFKKNNLEHFIMLRDFSLCNKYKCDDCYYTSKHQLDFFANIFKSATKDEMEGFFETLKNFYHDRDYFASFTQDGMPLCSGIIDSLANAEVALCLVKCLIRTGQESLITPLLCVIGNQIPWDQFLEDHNENVLKYGFSLENNKDRQHFVSKWMNKIFNQLDDKLQIVLHNNFRWDTY